MSPGSSSQCKTFPERREDIVLNKSRNGATIYDPLTAGSHRLNSTALEIWEQCDGSHRATDIGSRLAALFEMSLAESQAHVDRMIGELRSLQLLVADEAALSYLPFDST